MAYEHLFYTLTLPEIYFWSPPGKKMKLGPPLGKNPGSAHVQYQFEKIDKNKTFKKYQCLMTLPEICTLEYSALYTYIECIVQLTIITYFALKLDLKAHNALF